MGSKLIVVICVCIVILALEYSKTDYFKSTIDGMNYKISTIYDRKTQQGAADLMAKSNIFIVELLRHLRNKYILNRDGTPRQRHIVKNLLDRYNPDVVKENYPISSKYTSFVFNKGTTIGFCLREKKSGTDKLHDIGIIQFVVLHELSHLADDGYGHSVQFWSIFKFLISEAVMAGLYTPINYGMFPQEYCGIIVSYNPYFDETLNFR